MLWGHGAGGWLVMIIVMVGTWALVIAGLAAVIRRGIYTVRRDRVANHAELVAQFERGEIDEAEFNRLDEMLPTPH